MSLSDTPIPDLMRQLPHDKRGYPITFVTAIASDGTPNFAVTDEAKRQHVIVNNLCAICGKPNHKLTWLVGGYLSAFHPHGAFLDPPMHYDCASYALKVCPFIASPSYTHMRGMKMSKNMSGVFDMHPGGATKKPTIFVAAATKKIFGVVGRNELGQEYIRHIVPDRPYERIEFWKDGRQIDESRAWAIADAEQSKSNSQVN
jgi:hypothetical protein